MAGANILTISTSGGCVATVDVDRLQRVMGSQLNMDQLEYVLRDLVEKIQSGDDAASEEIQDLEEQLEALRMEGADLQRASDEIRYGNLGEALIYIERSNEGLAGIAELAAKELARSKTLGPAS